MKERKRSLAGKLTFLICIVAVLLAVVAITISYQVNKRTINQFYTDEVAEIGNTVASQLDPADVAALTENIQSDEVQALCNAEDSEGMEAYMREQGIYETYQKVCGVLDDFRVQMQVEDVYLILQVGQYSIAVADPVEALCYYGLSEENEAEFAEYTEMVPIEAIVSNGDYGWLCSGYQVLADSDGNAIALVGVDVSMEEVVAKRRDFLFSVSLEILILVILLSGGLLWLIRKQLVAPLVQLTDAAAGFLDEEGNGIGEAMELDIHTGDEIETLYHTLRQMEIDINEYTINLTAITAEKERIGAELNVATQIQADMLPSIFPPFPDRKEFDIYATMDPAKEVGGDFYDFFLVDDDHLAMVMADVSGKGVPAALFMVISKTLVKNAVLSGMGPSAALQHVNNQLCENNKADMFCTCWLGVMEISTGKVIAANAGHEYPTLRGGSGDFALMKDRHGMPLGCMEGIRYREYEFEIPDHGTLFVYTDGVAEATSSEQELFGTDRMLAALNENPDGTPNDLLRQVTDGINAFVKDAEQFDDITMLAMKRR